MSILKSIKTYRRNRKIRRHYGEVNPTHARVIGSSLPIRVDPSDERARKILLLDSIRGRERSNQAFWFLMLEAFKPTVCLDIGLNYGECLLAGRVPQTARGFAFEANPRLKPFIEETLAEHPDSERIDVVYAPVADQSGQQVTLRVNPSWSGRSHVQAGSQPAGRADQYSVSIQTVTTTVDESLPEMTDADRLLFKIDVEGFEPAVFRGMQKTIDSAGGVVGFAELSPEALVRQGADIESYWRFLSERFAVYFCTRKGEANRIAAASWAELSEATRNEFGDVILVRGLSAEEEAELLKTWRGLA